MIIYYTEDVSLKLQRFTKTYPLHTANFRKECVPNLIYDEVVVNGFITKEMYYADYDKTELVIEVNITYTEGADTLIERIDYEIKYFNEDGSLGMTVKKVKRLTRRQKISLLKKRRKTVSEDAQSSVIGLLQASYPEKSAQELLQLGGAFIIKYKTSLEIYESAGSSQIVTDLAQATEEWLDLEPSIFCFKKVQFIMQTS